MRKKEENAMLNNLVLFPQQETEEAYSKSDIHIKSGNQGLHLGF